METHDVDASLKEKLKCLVFIPIISRTYCDPKSFAWEHEFMAFVGEASNDRLGLKIKLSNGNIASRLLPVRIHDLETEDIKRFEEITGGVMRTLDFVFKTATGVNRPLKSSEDHPGDNINKTYYQDQINKVALAIREIVHGIIAEPIHIGEKENQVRDAVKETTFKKKESETRKSHVSTKKILSVILGIIAILIIAGVLLYPKLFKADKFERIRDADGKISIAVMPFENLTGDTTLNWFQRGISSLLINGLGNSSELAVFEDQTMFEVMEGMKQVYTAGFSPSAAREVARKVNAETYISGSFQGRDNTYWILVNLINSETGNILWTNKVEGNLKSSDYLALSDSLCYKIKNYLEIKVLEDNADFDFREAYPKSAEAYKFFVEGMNLVLNQNYEFGIRSLKKALEIDSTFTLASFYITYAYSNQIQGISPEVKTWIKKTYLHKDRVPPKYQLWIELWHLCAYSKNIDDIARCLDLLSETGINTRLFWSDIGVTYSDFLMQYDKSVNAFEKVMAICQERGSLWKEIGFWDRFQTALHKTGNHEREKEISNMGLKLLPDNSNWFYYRMALCALSQGNTSEANEYLIKYLAKHKELGTPESLLELFLGQMHEEANIMDQAEIHYRKACEIDPQNTTLLMMLAYFLINSEINVNEGLDLIYKVRVINPKITAFHYEGWALYKLGRYEEAAELIEKAWGRMTEFNLDVYRHLEAAKKAAAGQKN
jgi:TolB-like protein/Tfp pilus assembly protein PilF